MAINEALGNLSHWGMATTLASVGYLSLAEGDHATAPARFDESLAAYRKVGASNTLVRLGRARLAIE